MELIDADNLCSHSLLGNYKLIHLAYLLSKVINVEGSTAELGVFKGGGSRLIAKTLNRKHYCFDTWEGMPEVDPTIDKHHKGDFNTPYEDCQQYLSDCPLVELRKGFFPTTALGIQDRFCFVHLDGDIYNSTLNGICFFKPRMSKGGIILFDDITHCPGVDKAIAETQLPITRIGHPNRHQGFWVCPE